MDIVLAWIEQGDEILIAKRPHHAVLGGFWELPGGKIESDETPEAALVRECREELNIQINKAHLLQIHHDKKAELTFHIYYIDDYENQPVGHEGQVITWCHKHALDAFKMPASNREFMDQLLMKTAQLEVQSA